MTANLISDTFAFLIGNAGDYDRSDLAVLAAGLVRVVPVAQLATPSSRRVARSYQHCGGVRACFTAAGDSRCVPGHVTLNADTADVIFDTYIGLWGTRGQ